MTDALELCSISKEYAAHKAVDDISLSVREGEFFSLIGPSGCGKTTTLRVIAGFEKPTAGRILLRGSDVRALPPHRRDVSTVFQNYALFPHLTVAANVAFGLERKGRLAAADIRKRVNEMLELVQLSGKENRVPKQLSGGEKQRVALARSLVLQPSVLLLDEPLSALDPKLRKMMRAELKRLQQRVRTAFLFITHDQEEALALSDRIGVMNHGKLEQIGSAQEIYERPQTRFVAEFLGEVNWVDSQCAVRPEAMRIDRVQPNENRRWVRGVVDQVEFLGSRIQVRTRLQDGRSCKAETTANGDNPRPGEEVYVSWRECDEMDALR